MMKAISWLNDPVARSRNARPSLHAPWGALLALSLCGAAAAADSVTLRVNVFPTAKILPMFVGVDEGIFARHGLKVEVLHTENSAQQREGLAAGAFDIAQSAVDNAVAMVDAAGKDVVIVMGISSGMNEFIVQPDIRSVPEVRGRTLIVDAPNTAYALVAKKILLNAGLREGADYKVKPIGRGSARLEAFFENREYAAAVMNPPFSILAVAKGMKSLGRTVDMLGPYQADGVFVMRAWARANAQALERYLAAYVDSLRWALDPAHRNQCIAMLKEKLKLPQQVAERTYALLVDPAFGLTPEAKLDLQGFRNVLALRAEIEGGIAPPAEKYLDLSYYRRAIGTLGR
ncbi:MAG TPA: ABC transporter substrate-binding protein [Burkholderiales bacterium]|nr:ABC transporter substrate-binding protein [Burkholderiales bacterium]